MTTPFQTVPEIEHALPKGIRPLADFAAGVNRSAALLAAASPALPAHPKAPSLQPLDRRVFLGHKQPASLTRHWYGRLLADSLKVLNEISIVLLDYPASPPAARVNQDVFLILSDLTPKGHALRAIAKKDLKQAFSVLIAQLQPVCQHYIREATAVDIQPAKPTASREQQVKAKILKQAGKAVGLKEAAREIGMTRQALHKRIHAGKALGMMKDDRIIVPTIQFVRKGDKKIIIPGLETVTKLFHDSKAGPWSALEFLIGVDPNLEAKPIAALKAGRLKQVEHAARAYLDMDGR